MWYLNGTHDMLTSWLNPQFDNATKCLLWDLNPKFLQLIWVDGFGACFLFSLETQHTIGYGSRHTTTQCTEAIVLVSLQAGQWKYIFFYLWNYPTNYLLRQYLAALSRRLWWDLCSQNYHDHVTEAKLLSSVTMQSSQWETRNSVLSSGLVTYGRITSSLALRYRDFVRNDIEKRLVDIDSQFSDFS